ncbi:hypothetical protein AX15_006094 [Amanita polypyramis BW_CC]|nr:hypothetical protein AX15_006094 [Amanita polypyramis BW_CC]
MFLAKVYTMIEEMLVEEEGVFVTSDAEILDVKWSPLAPEADIPSADVIDQEWANSHSHAEFLWEQVRLNNFAVANWCILWTMNPPDKDAFPDYYYQWSKLDDYCHQATQTWYNIHFKELKDDIVQSLEIDPVMLRNIKMTTQWLADELEQVGKDPKFAAQQAVARVESITNSRQASRVPTPAILPSPKTHARSADTRLRSNLTTPENKGEIDIRTPTPRKIKERLESVISDITSLEYIDEPEGKKEQHSPMDVEMKDSSRVIVNPALIKHKVYTELVVDTKMDTREDFNMETSTSNNNSSSYHTVPSTLSKSLQSHSERIRHNKESNKGKEKASSPRRETPMHILSSKKELLDFMDIATKNLMREDQIQFRKELHEKGYSMRSAYLEVMLDGLFRDAIDKEIHQGHYQSIDMVYDNFNDPLE